MKKNILKFQNKAKTKYFDITFIEILFKNDFKEIKYFRQIIKNTLYKMVKNHEIYRLKRNLYTFDNKIIKFKLFLEENKNEVFTGLYLDYLRKNINACIFDSLIIIKKSAFKIYKLTLQEQEIFLNIFKQFKLFNNKIIIDDNLDRLIYRSILNFSYDHLDDEDYIDFVSKLIKKNNYSDQLIKDKLNNILKNEKNKSKKKNIILFYEKILDKF